MILKFQNIMPALTDDEYKQLEENILADGIRDPLVLWGEVLIDGHNRYRIAQKHGLEYKTVQAEFANDAEAKIWIITNQLGRRNIPSTATRAMLALELEPLYAEQAKERQKGGQGGVLLVPHEGTSKGKTRDQLAKIARVSKSSIDYAKFIKEHAPKEIMDKVESGEMTLRTAYRETAKLFPPKKPQKAEPQVQEKPIKQSEPLTEKVCTTCGRSLLIEKFYLSQGRYSSSCAQCEQMKRREGISPTIRENIDAIQKASDYLTDTERVMEYSIEDVIETVSSEFDRLIRVIETEVKNHNDLIKNPLNKEAFIKSLVQGVGLIQSKINELARIV
jgi:hypothetical protein